MRHQPLQSDHRPSAVHSPIAMRSLTESDQAIEGRNRDRMVEPHRAQVSVLSIRSPKALSYKHASRRSRSAATKSTARMCFGPRLLMR